jgi:signal transduction protein with GAF and PtsI domain
MIEEIEAQASTGNWDGALAAVIALMKADSGTIHVIGSDGQLHLRAASAGIPPPVIEIIRVVPVGKGMAGLAAERREPVTICNIQTDTSGDVRAGARATGLEGAIALPMLSGELVAGVLGVANRAERTFTAEETDELLAIGRALARFV